MDRQAQGPIARELRLRLERAFAPQLLEIEDQSERHRGHAGFREEGESHFRVVMVSAAFSGLSRIARERRVHDCLRDLLACPIHALSLRLLAPEETGEGCGRPGPDPR